MARKRMFSKLITDSDAFIDMPSTAQLLYFHLAMNADDDGFVSSPKRVMRMINSNTDDYKILLAKRFLITFESGVCVIKHWWMHNEIKKDRYHLTAYQEELNTLQIKDNGAYTDGLVPECIQNVSKVVPQTKLNETKLNETKLKNTHGEFENVFLSKEEYDKLVIKISGKNTLLLIEELSGHIASVGKKYSSHYATLLNWDRRIKKNEKNKPKALQVLTKYDKYEDNK